MKTVRTFLLMMFSAFSTLLQAQEKKFEGQRGLDIRIGYGVGPAQSLQNSFHNDLIPDLADPGYNVLKKKGSGMFNLSLSYQTASRLSFGIDAIYGTVRSEFTYPNLSSIKPVSQWFIVMAKANFVYYQEMVHMPHIQLYGGVAVGSAFRDASVDGSSTSFNSSHFAYQITPLGIRTGQKFGFWAELGYGFKGFINAGLCTRL
jgi:hypothetical protein